jgi:hypothetical protein
MTPNALNIVQNLVKKLSKTLPNVIFNIFDDDYFQSLLKTPGTSEKPGQKPAIGNFTSLGFSQ